MIIRIEYNVWINLVILFDHQLQKYENKMILNLKLRMSFNLRNI